jgi:hypothetical protein
MKSGFDETVFQSYSLHGAVLGGKRRSGAASCYRRGQLSALFLDPEDRYLYPHRRFLININRMSAACIGFAVRPKRRLAAIVAADVEGYSRLMPKARIGREPLRFDSQPTPHSASAPTPACR